MLRNPSVLRWRITTCLAVLCALFAVQSSTGQQQAATAVEEATEATAEATAKASAEELSAPARILPTQEPVAAADGQTTADVLLQEQELAEIERIKRTLGGSILRGSILDTQDESLEAASKQEIRRAVGLPQIDSSDLAVPANDRPKTDLGSSLRHAGLTKIAPVDAGDQDAMNAIVDKLRSRVLQLQTIAHQLESIRHYNAADDLREAADELRMIARQLDRRPVGSR